MFKRTIFLTLLMLSIIGLSYAVPGNATIANSAFTSCSGSTVYNYERIDGVCYLVTYCDGTFLNQLPAPDYMCGP